MSVQAIFDLLWQYKHNKQTGTHLEFLNFSNLTVSFNFEEGEMKRNVCSPHSRPQRSLVCQNWQPGNLPMSTFVKKPALYFWGILHKSCKFSKKRSFFWVLSVSLLDSASSEMKSEKQICYGECFVLSKLDPFLLPNDPWLPKKCIQPTHINSSFFSLTKKIHNSKNWEF